MMSLEELAAFWRQYEHVGASLAFAHKTYGEEFERAYSDLLAMSPEHEGTLAFAKSIWDAIDPGQELMRWHWRTIH